MLNGAFLVIAVLVVLLVLGLLLLVVAGRRRRATSLMAATQELPIVELPRRDWAASVQPLRLHETSGNGSADGFATTPPRPFRPPIYRGRSAGVVLRQTPLAARWPAAMRRRPRGGRLPERRSPRTV